MTIIDLKHKEMIALVGLVRLMISADGKVSDKEKKKLNDIFIELGKGTFHNLYGAFEGNFQNEHELIKFLATMTDHKISSVKGGKFDQTYGKIGQMIFSVLLEEFNYMFPEKDRFKIYLKGIDRLEAREYICEVLEEVALIDVASPIESHILEWLKRDWNIKK